MLSGYSIDAVSAGSVVWDHHFALCQFVGVGFVLVLELDGEVEVLLCPIVYGDVVVQQLPTSLELCLQTSDRPLHFLNRLLVDVLGGHLRLNIGRRKANKIYFGTLVISLTISLICPLLSTVVMTSDIKLSWVQGYRSEAHIFLKIVELGAEKGEVAVDLLAVGNHGVDLVGESHVLGLLGNQVVLAEYRIEYIFSSNILTSIISFVLDYSVECFPSFSTPWNSLVRFLRVDSSSVSWELSFLVRDCVSGELPRPFRAIRRRCCPFRGRGFSWERSL